MPDEAWQSHLYRPGKRSGSNLAISLAASWEKGDADRDVSGRRLRSSGRGHHPSALGTRVSPGTVSNLNQKTTRVLRSGATGRSDAPSPLFISMGSWSNALGPLKCAMSPCWWLSVLPLTAVAKSSQWPKVTKGTRLVGVASCVFQKRGLKEVQLIINDACPGLIEPLGDFCHAAK